MFTHPGRHLGMMGDDDAAPVLGRRSALSGEARITGNAGVLRMRMRSAGGRSICFGWLCESGYTLSGLLAASSACTVLLREEKSFKVDHKPQFTIETPESLL